MQNKSGFDNGFIGVYPLAIVPLSSRKCLENVSEKYAKWGYIFFTRFFSKRPFLPLQNCLKWANRTEKNRKMHFF